MALGLYIYINWMAKANIDDAQLQLKRRTIAAEKDGKNRVANHR